MNYFLALISLFLLLINLAIDKDYLRPSIIFGIGYTYSSAVLAINSFNWNYQISGKTFLMILLGQVLFIIGERFAVHLKPNRKIRVKGSIDASYSETRNSVFFIIGFILLVGLLTVRLGNIRQVISTYGTGQYLLSTYRAFGIGEDNTSLPVKFLEIFCSAFSFYYFNKFCYLSGKYNVKRYKYILLLVMYIVACAMSSNRSNVLGNIFIATLIWLFTQRMLNHQMVISAKNKRRILIIAFLGFALFAALGSLTGKTQRSGIIESISGYSAASIPALDTFIKSYNDSPQFGYNTLESLKRILELIGLKVNYNISYYAHGTFVKIGPIKTNIYTCFRDYIMDYGYVGALIVLLLVGFGFGLFYKNKVRNKQSKAANYVIYSIFALYILFSFLTERIFSNILTATTLIQVLVLIVLYASNPLGDELGK